MDAGWDGSFTLEPTGLTNPEVQQILECEDIELEGSKITIAQEIKPIKVKHTMFHTSQRKLLHKPLFGIGEDKIIVGQFFLMNKFVLYFIRS